ncbi:MAG TPA: YqeG family HAD IIIA-type phosphatase [Bacillota bacterium]|nr:YqeG family HAD IIIA-type phosphatase [Bacillota bacterium]
MLRKLCPQSQTTSVCDLDSAFFTEQGIKGIIIDLDNTLVPWGEDSIEPEMAAWVRTMQRVGLRFCILSNALEARVRAVADILGVPFVSRAVKPRKSPFRKAMEILETQPEETAVIGDQLFTDILGGNRLDLYTVWTTPLSQEEFVSTKAVRRLERLVVRRFKKKGILQ